MANRQTTITDTRRQWLASIGFPVEKFQASDGGSDVVAASQGGATGAQSAADSLPQPMAEDCVVERGKVPGPANFVLCKTHEHVLDTAKRQIVAPSIDAFLRLHPEFQKHRRGAGVSGRTGSTALSETSSSETATGSDSMATGSAAGGVIGVADSGGSSTAADLGNANVTAPGSEEDDPSNANSTPSDPSRLRSEAPKSEDGGGMSPNPDAKTMNWALSPGVTGGSASFWVGGLAMILVLKNLDNGCIANLSFAGVGLGMGERMLTIATTEFTPFTTSEPVDFSAFKKIRGSVKLLGGGVGVGGSLMFASFWGLDTTPDWISIGGLELGLPDAEVGVFAGDFFLGSVSTS